MALTLTLLVAGLTMISSPRSDAQGASGDESCSFAAESGVGRPDRSDNADRATEFVEADGYNEAVEAIWEASGQVVSVYPNFAASQIVVVVDKDTKHAVRDTR